MSLVRSCNSVIYAYRATLKSKIMLQIRDQHDSDVSHCAVNTHIVVVLHKQRVSHEQTLSLFVSN